MMVSIQVPWTRLQSQRVESELSYRGLVPAAAVLLEVRQSSGRGRAPNMTTPFESKLRTCSGFDSGSSEFIT